jgi:hypothetical protein
MIPYNETNLMHYLSSVYSVTLLLHVSGLLVAHYQVVTMYMCNNWNVLNVLVDCSWPTKPAGSQLKRTRHTNCCTYALLPHDNEQLASSKHVEV